jgi:hypothetical protein
MRLLHGIFLCRKLVATAALPAFAFAYATLAHANFTDCGRPGVDCGWTLSVTPLPSASQPVPGETVTTSGDLTVQNGSIVLQGSPVVQSDGLAATVSGFSAQGDPSLAFGFSANNTSDGAATYAFSFFVPISLVGPGIATATADYSLTSTNATGGSLFTLPTSTSKVVVASDTDLDATPPVAVSKNVDLGGACTIAAPGQVHCGAVGFPGFAAGPSLFGAAGTSYELMSATVQFGLTGHTSVGGTVFINQVEAIPEPSSLALILAGLGAVGWTARRRMSA